MVYFTKSIFNNILQYCYDSIKDEQRKKHKILIKHLSKFNNDWYELYINEIKSQIPEYIELNSIIDILIEYDFISPFLILISSENTIQGPRTLLNTNENKYLSKNIWLIYQK